MNLNGIKLLIVMFLMMSGIETNAQGVVVYKTDGTRIEVPYNELDSIVTYETETVGTVADAVDLGLPSGTLWASWNVGATAPEEYGGYYAWGETEEKTSYNEDTYKYYDQTWQEYINIGDEISGTEYDVAHVMWGDGWCMPTKAQIQELIDNCTWEWISYNGTVNGYKIIGTNGNRIFIPAAGFLHSTSLYGEGIYGRYWSGTLNSGSGGGAYELYSDSGNRSVYNNDLCTGRSVRPVREK